MSAPTSKPPMRGLTLTQPWASLVASGVKKIETRSWNTNYRGLVAIHAAKAMDAAAREFCIENTSAFNLLWAKMNIPPSLAAEKVPRGQILAVAELYEVKMVCAHMGRRDVGYGDLAHVIDTGDPEPVIVDRWEYALGDFSAMRYLFFLRGAVALPTPVPCKGMLGLWAIPADVLTQIEEQVK